MPRPCSTGTSARLLFAAELMLGRNLTGTIGGLMAGRMIPVVGGFFGFISVLWNW